MITCKYCGTELSEGLHCSFCEITFAPEEVSIDGQRVSAMIEVIPFEKEELLAATTEILLRSKTLELYYYLKLARKFKNEAFKIKDEASVRFYLKKSMVIENILREREGDFPARLTDKYLKTRRDQVINFEKELAARKQWTMYDYCYDF